MSLESLLVYKKVQQDGKGGICPKSVGTVVGSSC